MGYFYFLKSAIRVYDHPPPPPSLPPLNRTCLWTPFHSDEWKVGYIFKKTAAAVRCFQLRKKVLRLEATSYQSSDRTVQHLCLWLQNEHEWQFCEEFITTKHYYKEGKHHVCCWSKQYDSIFVAEYSHDRLLSKEKTKSYHPPPPPLHLAPERWLTSRFTCEFEKNFGSRAHRAGKEWVDRWRVPGQNFPPTRTSEVSSEAKGPTNLFNEFHNFFICISVIRL